VKHACLLIADSHANMLKAVEGLLSALFDTVVAVSDEDSLLQSAAALQPDLIIVDLSLPVSGPGNVLRRLRGLPSTSAAKVIALSIHDEAEAARDSLAAGAMGFVLKRSAATDLIPAVREVLEDHTYVSPVVRGDFSAAGIF
jgi:DNA-binding NarL/FixJ family response regulator